MPIASLPNNPRKAIAHLTLADPALGAAMALVGKFALTSRPATLHWFCRGIIGQQLSTVVAAAIGSRFTARVGEHCAPRDILTPAPEELRALGLSGAKVASVRALAEFWQKERLDDERILSIPDDELIAMFTQVRGVGPWTVKMFLIFCLRRPNVLPFEDLGVRAGIKRIDNLAELPSIKETAIRGQCWAPYSTVAAHYCWKVLNV